VYFFFLRCVNVYGFAQYLVRKVQQIFEIVLQVESVKICVVLLFFFSFNT